MEFLTEWWGVKEKISPLEITARGLAMFALMLVLLRFTGMRSFSKGSVFDNVIIILLGAVLGRGVVGATPFFSAVICGVVLLLFHKFISRVTFYNKWAGSRIKGNPVMLYKNGEFLQDQMKASDITENDIYEELRLTLHQKDMRCVDEIYMERSGKISFIVDEGMKQKLSGSE